MATHTLHHMATDGDLKKLPQLFPQSESLRQNCEPSATNFVSSQARRLQGNHWAPFSVPSWCKPFDSQLVFACFCHMSIQHRTSPHSLQPKSLHGSHPNLSANVEGHSPLAEAIGCCSHLPGIYDAEAC